jgi:hypothetical protein
LHGASVTPLSRYIAGDTPRLALWLLTGAVFCVLFVGAANVAGLSLARGVGRAREMAIRMTLGATPGRISGNCLSKARADEASDGLFSTLGTSVVRGRAFSSSDRPGSPAVVIVNILGLVLWEGARLTGPERRSASPAHCWWGGRARACSLASPLPTR